MTTLRSNRASRTSRTIRGAAFALVAGAGIALVPAAAGAAPASAAVIAQPAVAPNAAAQRVVDFALAQVGKPYAWGAAGPGSYDCSGLSQAAYRAAGVALPHSSRLQSTIGVPIGVWDLKPGDLLFYYSPVSHVGVYIGNGQMVHASTAGKPVSVVAAASVPGWVGARRIV